MKNVLLAAACLLLGGAAAHAQNPAATESKALQQRINQLMRNPAKPQQELRLDLKGCHATQTIRDNKADVQASAPISVSYNKGGEAGWAAKVSDGKFELALDFEWSEVEPLTYLRRKPEKGKDEAPYEIKIRRVRKGNTTNFELPLYTTDEKAVLDVVRRLEKVRQGCQ
ncbi:hypothetical protein D3Y59_11490 [Hymenobacter oligotrophus]|uniref:Uncharacterized protein n=1 Tax=Hymenobacter oligotrophus TaxID=2319843 RepID=A0A3B7REE8_9BACT|nr:hypothetical protein [Hymenobacter oligotrophus]AYA37616.1 hypothetical protein D3Y59_11490 [Hymenobacter oligotrophus]